MRIQFYIVCHILLAKRHIALYYRVASLANLNLQALVYYWSGIIILHCKLGKGAQKVYLRHNGAALLYCPYLLLNLCHYGGIDALLYCKYLLLCSQNLLLVLFEFLGYIALRIYKGLLAYPLRRHFIFMGIAHLQVVAKDVVVANLKGCYAGALALLLLQIQQILLTVARNASEVVQLRIHTICNDISFPEE